MEEPENGGVAAAGAGGPAPPVSGGKRGRQLVSEPVVIPGGRRTRSASGPGAEKEARKLAAALAAEEDRKAKKRALSASKAQFVAGAVTEPGSLTPGQLAEIFFARARCGGNLPDWNDLTPQSKDDLYTALFQCVDCLHDFGTTAMIKYVSQNIPIRITLTTVRGHRETYNCTVENLQTIYLTATPKPKSGDEDRFKIFALKNYKNLGHDVRILSIFPPKITTDAVRLMVDGTPYARYEDLPVGEYTTTKAIAAQILQHLAPHSVVDDAPFIITDGCPNPPGSVPGTINVKHTMATKSDSSSGFAGYPNVSGGGQFEMKPNILMSMTSPQISFSLRGTPGEFYFVISTGAAAASHNIRFPSAANSGPSIDHISQLCLEDDKLHAAYAPLPSGADNAETVKANQWDFKGVLRYLHQDVNLSDEALRSVLFTEKANGDSRPPIEIVRLYPNVCKALVSVDRLSALNGATYHGFTSMYVQGDTVVIYKPPAAAGGGGAASASGAGGSGGGGAASASGAGGSGGGGGGAASASVAGGGAAASARGQGGGGGDTDYNAYLYATMQYNELVDRISRINAAADASRSYAPDLSVKANEDPIIYSLNILKTQILRELVRRNNEFYTRLQTALVDKNIRKMPIQKSSLPLDFGTLTENIYTQLDTLLKYKNMIDRLESINPIKDLSEIKANWESLTHTFRIDEQDIKILFDSLQNEINKTHDDYVRQLMGEKLAGMYALIQCNGDAHTLQSYIETSAVIEPVDTETAIGNFWDEKELKEQYLYKINQAKIEIEHAQFDLSNNPADADIQSDIDELKQYISCCDAYVQFLDSQSDDDYDDISQLNITEFVNIVKQISNILAPIVIPASGMSVEAAANPAAVRRMNTPSAPTLSRAQQQRAANARRAMPRAGAGDSASNSSFSSYDGSTGYARAGVGTKGKHIKPFILGGPSGYGQTKSALDQRRTQRPSKHLRGSTPEGTPLSSAPFTPTASGIPINHHAAMNHHAGGASKNKTRKQTRKHKSKTRKNRPRFTKRTRRNKH